MEGVIPFGIFGSFTEGEGNTAGGNSVHPAIQKIILITIKYLEFIVLNKCGIVQFSTKELATKCTTSNHRRFQAIKTIFWLVALD